MPISIYFYSICFLLLLGQMWTFQTLSSTFLTFPSAWVSAQYSEGPMKVVLRPGMAGVAQCLGARDHPSLSRNVLLEYKILVPLKVTGQSKSQACGFTPRGLLLSWLEWSVRSWQQPACALCGSACVNPFLCVSKTGNTRARRAVRQRALSGPAGPPSTSWSKSDLFGLWSLASVSKGIL